MPSLSANGQMLFFSSNRRGGQGGNDIWISQRNRKGHWSPPANAGPVINTRFSEESPFIHPDGRSLYFMSEGHPGFGGQDVFLSRRNRLDMWSVPVNLGYPVNTSSNEGGLVVNLSGDEAYIFTNRSGINRTDPDAVSDLNILAFVMPPAFRPGSVTYLKLQVVSEKDDRPLRADITIQELPRNQLYSRGVSDHEGEYLICIPSGRSYLIEVSAPGYMYHSDRVDLVDDTLSEKPFFRRVVLTPVEQDQSDIAKENRPVVLENIFFETGSDSLLPESQFELEALTRFLNQEKDVRIEIHGHTDDVGSQEDNQRLSEARARAVYDALIRMGTDPDRLQYRGFGETRPVADNTSPEGRQKNRRTEFIILR
jgi:outer membrane protein OmpA-like peptidoglycan-associated protein